MKKIGFIVIITSLMAFLSSCASPAATFREKMAKLNVECQEVRTKDPKLPELEVDKACWTAALQEFPEYRDKIESMISLIGKLEEKQNKGEDITEDLKQYRALTLAMIQYAASRAESSEASQQSLMQWGLIWAVGAPRQ